jgi:metal-dependent amidase/aminoacylase/carboxypeptidase family protein
VQEQIHAELRRAFEIARTLGGDYELKIEIGAPPMINSPQASNLIAAVAIDLLGKENVLPWIDELGAEDFGSFSELAPGAMFALGTDAGHIHRHLHSPDFDLDESAMPVGTAIFVAAALRFLRGEK